MIGMTVPPAVGAAAGGLVPPEAADAAVPAVPVGGNARRRGAGGQGQRGRGVAEGRPLSGGGAHLVDRHGAPSVIVISASWRANGRVKPDHMGPPSTTLPIPTIQVVDGLPTGSSPVACFAGHDGEGVDYSRSSGPKP